MKPRKKSFDFAREMGTQNIYEGTSVKQMARGIKRSSCMKMPSRKFFSGL